MTLCAGLCEQKDGLITIKLSEPLLIFRPEQDLHETLLHEMIHAYLMLLGKHSHEHHGPNFKREMDRINSQSGFDITIYHNFHEEVDFYRTHVWKCDGPCQQ